MKNTVCLLFSLVLLNLAVPTFALSPLKDDTIGVRNWLIVPVFYITNRKYAGVDGSPAYSEEPSLSGLSFGVKNMVVPRPATSAWTADRIKQMSWQEISSAHDQAGKAPKVQQENCPVKDRLLTKASIMQSFQSYTASTGAQQSIVFVHGCCADFDTSLKRAAKISAYTGAPVLAYDWLSPVGFGKYLQNETRVRQSTDDFCRFLYYLGQVQDPSTITLIGHSMGAEFIDQAMVRRAIVSSFSPRRPYREIILSNPDIDARTFLEHGPEFASNAFIVRLYISTADDRLDASSIAHGGFSRLGLPGPLLTELAQLKGVNVVDITESDYGHEIPFPVMAALHSDNSAMLPAAYKLEKLPQGYWRLKKMTQSVQP